MYSDRIHNAQRVLRASAGYRGAIDGIIGPGTLASAARVRGADRFNGERQVIAAMQIILEGEGLIEARGVDGLYGPQTDHAFQVWRGEVMPDRAEAAGFGVQSQMVQAFGPPGGRACTAGRVLVPWRMVLAWDQGQEVKTIACHEIVAPMAQRAFDRVRVYYGDEAIRDLGLDQFGGCFNLRKVRGGSAWSTHAFGAAFDFDPARNRLHWGADRARLAAADARPFWDIWEAHGFLSLGRARNYDWMHVQAPGLG